MRYNDINDSLADLFLDDAMQSVVDNHYSDDAERAYNDMLDSTSINPDICDTLDMIHNARKERRAKANQEFFPSYKLFR